MKLNEDVFKSLRRVFYALSIGAFLPFASFAADSEADEEVVGEAQPVEEGPKRQVLVMPQKRIDPEIATELVLKKLELLRAAWNGENQEEAERYFNEALSIPNEVPEKELVLLTMGRLYQEKAMYPQSAAVYEKLAMTYPESRKRPEVFMELGNIYRKLGALELAISKYYMVMNASINIKFDQLEKYKNLSMQAKLEIAATHNERGERNEAYRMYQHLYRLDLKPVDRLRVHYHMCYLLYELGDYQQAVAQLKLFLDTYPITPHAPEIRYLLAKSYDKLNRKPEALREVVAILQRQSSVDTQDSESADYWKRRMGNELANEFYEKGDFRSALAIYQALARYSDAAQWRWPAVHQIGLCFERLGLPEKAKMAYSQIANPEEGTVDPSQLNDHLKSLQEMAKWRLEHLNWEDDLIARLSILKAQ